MISDDLELNIIFLAFTILFTTAKLFGLLDQWHKEVGFKVSWRIFKNRNNPFKSHPSINVLMRKWFISIFRGVVKLTEHDVPNFKVPFVFATWIIFRIIVSQIIKFLTTVVENFSIRTRRTLTNIPEIILIRNKVILCNTNFTPLVISIMILWVVCNIKPFWIKTKPVVTC